MTRRGAPVAQVPSTRRERRALERSERATVRRSPRYRQDRPAWRSPMALITGGALIIGLAIIVFAMLNRPAQPSDDIIAPGFHLPDVATVDRTMGRADAPVTVEIWSDFQCPGCRQLAQRIEPALIADFVVPGTARLVYRDAAFQGKRVQRPYDESVEPAAAARCAADQGAFWSMHAWIFANWNGENEGAFRAERLRAIAEASGLDIARYDSCMAVGDKQAAVRAETQQAISLGVAVTPTLVINGEMYDGGLNTAEIVAAIRDAAGLNASPPAGSGQ